MPIVVSRGDIKIECQTPHEAVAVALLLDGKEAPSVAGNGHQQGRERVLRDVVLNLGEKQQKALRAIAEQKSGKLDRQLFQALGLVGDTANKALGGILGAVGKAVQAVDMKTEAVYTVRETENGRLYRPTDLLRLTGGQMGWTIM